jgi:hypothetical protein
MRLLYFQLIFIIGGFLPSKVKAQTEADTATYGEVVFDTLKFDLGEIKPGEIIKVEVKYYNKGPGPLKIYKVVTPCVCTEATYQSEGLEMDKWGIIKLTFNPAKIPKGYFKRTATILHDGSDSGFDQVELTGIIK